MFSEGFLLPWGEGQDEGWYKDAVNLFYALTPTLSHRERGWSIDLAIRHGMKSPTLVGGVFTIDIHDTESSRLCDR